MGLCVSFLRLLLALGLPLPLPALHQHPLLLQHLGQLAVLVHRHEDIAPADELLVDVQLRDGRPVGVLLDACRVSVSERYDPTQPRARRERNVPCRKSWSSNTLYAANFSGSTPCRPSTWMLAREKPHWGVSGVPFMKRTTGADPTALSMAWRTASERRRRWAASERRNGEGVFGLRGVAAGRIDEKAVWRTAWRRKLVFGKLSIGSARGGSPLIEPFWKTSWYAVCAVSAVWRADSGKVVSVNSEASRERAIATFLGRLTRPPMM